MWRILPSTLKTKKDWLDSSKLLLVNFKLSGNLTLGSSSTQSDSICSANCAVSFARILDIVGREGSTANFGCNSLCRARFWDSSSIGKFNNDTLFYSFETRNGTEPSGFCVNGGVLTCEVFVVVIFVDDNEFCTGMFVWSVLLSCVAFVFGIRVVVSGLDLFFIIF